MTEKKRLPCQHWKEWQLFICNYIYVECEHEWWCQCPIKLHGTTWKSVNSLPVKGVHLMENIKQTIRDWSPDYLDSTIKHVWLYILLCLSCDYHASMSCVSVEIHFKPHWMSSLYLRGIFSWVFCISFLLHLVVEEESNTVGNASSFSLLIPLWFKRSNTF